MKIIMLIISLILSGALFANEQKSSKPDEKPQKDYYHKDFDKMDDEFEKKINHDNSEDTPELKRRDKKA